MRTVAILGNASKTRDLLPYEAEMDIWPMSIHAVKARRCSAVLEMHQDVMTHDRWKTYPDYEEYRRWLRTIETPIYMHQPHPEIPASVKYPREEIEAKFGKHLWKGDTELKKFYGGTASYGIALALFLGYERIEVYGIELSARPTYDDERDTFFFWIGKATGLGVDVFVHEKSGLVSEMMYPYASPK